MQMRPLSTRAHRTRLFYNREAGFTLIDSTVIVLITVMACTAVVQVTKSQRSAVGYAAGVPTMQSQVSSEVANFRLAPYVVPSETPLNTLGTTEPGDTMLCMRSAKFDGELSVRLFNVCVFLSGVPWGAIGGAARLEPIPVQKWEPNDSSTSFATTTYSLVVTNSTPLSGSVSSGGMFAAGTLVPIVATPHPGKTFVRWDGTAVITNRNAASTTMTLDEDRTVTAVFSP